MQEIRSNYEETNPIILPTQNSAQKSPTPTEQLATQLDCQCQIQPRSPTIDYEIQERIGQGKTCEVFKCIDPVSGVEYALKKFRDHIESKFDIENEIEAFQNFNHENILKLKNYDQQQKSYLLLEYINQGELFDYIYQADKKFPRSLARYYFKQLLQGISHMHSKQYCHRDIKLENCLLDDNYNLKICDFGFACKNIKGSENMDRILGTDGYMAPEMCQHLQYDGFQTDIFALGVNLFILYSGFPPIMNKAIQTDPFYRFFALNKQNKFWENLEKKFGLVYESQFKDLINKMLEVNPSKRITLEEVLQHEFFDQEIMNDADRIKYMTELKQNMSNKNE